MIALLSLVLASADPAPALAAMQRGDFEQALELLQTAATEETGGAARARLQLLQAECFEALGDRAAADQRLGRALDDDAKARLDPERVSPDLVARLEALREKRVPPVTFSAGAEDAVLRVDDRPAGVTPLTLRLAAGPHSASAMSLDGRRTATAQFVVEPGKPLVVELHLSTAAREAQAEGASAYLKAASVLFENLEYERALVQIEKGRKVAQSVFEDTLLALYEGVMLLELGRATEADAAFQTALSLSPELQVPVKVAPAVTRAIEKQRAVVKRRIATMPKAPKVEPAAEVVGYRPGKPGYLSWGLGGLGVLAAGVGAVLGLDAQARARAIPQETLYDDALGMWRDSSRRADTANVLFAIAGTAAVAAIIAWLVGAP